MNKKKNAILLLTLLFKVSCGGSGDTGAAEESPNEESVANNETSINNESDSSISNNSEKEKTTEKANIEEVLKEFPQGALSFLSDKEQQLSLIHI